MYDPWITRARCDSRAPLGLPVKAAVYIMRTAAASSTPTSGSVAAPPARKAS